jgi:hypothetical protein
MKTKSQRISLRKQKGNNDTEKEETYGNSQGRKKEHFDFPSICDSPSHHVCPMRTVRQCLRLSTTQ